MSTEYQIYEFLLAYADHLQTVHEYILQFILHIIPQTTSIQQDWKEYLRIIHVLLLHTLHGYLTWTLVVVDTRKSKQQLYSPIRFFQWISWCILICDWCSMDILTVLGEDPYGWFRIAGAFLFILHVVIPLWFFVESIRKYDIEYYYDGVSPVRAWEYSYVVYGFVVAIARVSGTLSWVWTEIVKTFSEISPENQLLVTFILVYTIAVFYILFPRITDQKGRPFSLFSYVFMGWVTGACDILILAMAYRLTTSYIIPSFDSLILVFSGTLLMYLVPTAMYYSLVFNPILAPDHRIPKWDLVKILTLTFSDILAVYATVYCGLYGFVFVNQLIVLGGIITSMRFPAPWSNSIPLLKTFTVISKPH